jgi:hypothetical protein
MRRKAASRISIHFFQGRLDFGLFAFAFLGLGGGIFAKRPLGRT